MEARQQRLLQDQGFACVLFAEVDEMVVPDPLQWPLGLGPFLRAFRDDRAAIYLRPQGYTVAHDLGGDRAEPPLDWNKRILVSFRLSSS